MLILTLLACFNDCSYFERCDGDTLLVCGEGPDQQVNRKENRVPCEAPNDVCVEVGDDNATCAHVPDPCEAGSAATCDGDLLLECAPFTSSLGLYSGDAQDQSFVQAVDCAADGRVCAVGDDGAAACVAPE